VDSGRILATLIRLLGDFDLAEEAMHIGLLSLMLLQESRQAASATPAGELILLENQDRSLRNREQIAEGVALVKRALKSHVLALTHCRLRLRRFMQKRNRPL
jgi:predicted RNA polymerase sigma factor